jgi:predicted oxidoreductase (fatty acid repression mutant protein)
MKNKSLQDSIQDRRTYYQLSNESPVSDEEIQRIIEHVAYWPHHLSIRNRQEWYCFWAKTTKNYGNSPKLS